MSAIIFILVSYFPKKKLIIISSKIIVYAFSSTLFNRSVNVINYMKHASLFISGKAVEWRQFISVTPRAQANLNILQRKELMGQSCSGGREV